VSQPLVLAIEPDPRQAAIIKRIVREKALADVAVVDSRDAAIEAMRTSMPDVLLLTALKSPFRRYPAKGVSSTRLGWAKTAAGRRKARTKKTRRMEEPSLLTPEHPGGLRLFLS